MKNTLYQITLLSFFLVVGSVQLWGQGSTSSRITGQVTDGTESLIGANVVAVHGPTGFSYGTATNICLLYTSPSPRDRTRSRMPSSA